MNKITSILGLFLLSVFLSGCIVISVGRKPVPPPDMELQPAATADSVTLAEIDAATRLTFENNRLSAMNAIAGRTNLSAAAQVHLVRNAYKDLTFENSKISLLGVIINNPAFCNPAKQTILTHLDDLAFENNRSAILAAINQRGELKD